MVIAGTILPAEAGVNLAERTVKSPLEGDLPEVASVKHLYGLINVYVWITGCGYVCMSVCMHEGKGCVWMARKRREDKRKEEKSEKGGRKGRTGRGQKCIYWRLTYHGGTKEGHKGDEAAGSKELHDSRCLIGMYVVRDRWIFCLPV